MRAVNIESRLSEMLIELYEESEVVRLEREASEEAERRQEESNGNMNEKTASWIDWAKKKADWFDPTIARTDELLGYPTN